MNTKEKVQTLVYYNNLIREATTKYEQKFMASTQNLSTMCVNVLTTIGVHKSCTQSTIAKSVSLTPGSITQIIDKLELKNLVKRQRCKVDRRKIYVALTAKGKKIYDLRMHGIESVFREWLSRLTSQEQEMLLTIMAKIAQ